MGSKEKVPHASMDLAKVKDVALVTIRQNSQKGPKIGMKRGVVLSNSYKGEFTWPPVQLFNSNNFT